LTLTEGNPPPSEIHELLPSQLDAIESVVGQHGGEFLKIVLFFPSGVESVVANMFKRGISVSIFLNWFRQTYTWAQSCYFLDLKL
jgi:hypothetical protein